MRQCIITVDTEWDRKKEQSEPVSVENLLQLTSFQQLCENYDVHPVYFCTYEALQDDNCVKMLKEKSDIGIIEIGAHLHPWSNPPFPYGDPQEERTCGSFPHEYSLDVFEDKLTVLTDSIREQCGIAPVSYRAGRFGFVDEHIPILARRGYEVDSSITPGVSHEPSIGWKGNGVDYTDVTDIGQHRRHHGGHSILEVPITIFPRENMLSLCAKKMFGIQRRSNAMWFRIYPETTEAGIEHMIDYAAHNLDVSVFMMHSNELDHRTNPYFDTKAKQQRFLYLLEVMFKKIKFAGIRTITFRDYLTERNTSELSMCDHRDN